MLRKVLNSTNKVPYYRALWIQSVNLLTVDFSHIDTVGFHFFFKLFLLYYRVKIYIKIHNAA